MLAASIIFSNTCLIKVKIFENRSRRRCCTKNRSKEKKSRPSFSFRGDFKTFQAISFERSIVGRNDLARVNHDISSSLGLFGITNFVNYINRRPYTIDSSRWPDRRYKLGIGGTIRHRRTRFLPPCRLIGQPTDSSVVYNRYIHYQIVIYTSCAVIIMMTVHIPMILWIKTFRILGFYLFRLILGTFFELLHKVVSKIQLALFGSAISAVSSKNNYSCFWKTF